MRVSEWFQTLLNDPHTVTVLGVVGLYVATQIQQRLMKARVKMLEAIGLSQLANRVNDETFVGRKIDHLEVKHNPNSDGSWLTTIMMISGPREGTHKELSDQSPVSEPAPTGLIDDLSHAHFEEALSPRA